MSKRTYGSDSHKRHEDTAKADALLHVVLSRTTKET